MAKQYRRTPMVRAVGALTSWMARLGMGPASLLTTTGRVSQQPHQVPVAPIERDGAAYLVAPYGDVGWVKNLRAHPEATLVRGKDERRIHATEVTGPEVAGVVAAYHAREAFARRYMDVPDNPDVDDFAERSARFPVFRIGSG